MYRASHQAIIAHPRIGAENQSVPGQRATVMVEFNAQFALQRLGLGYRDVPPPLGWPGYAQGGALLASGIASKTAGVPHVQIRAQTTESGGTTNLNPLTFLKTDRPGVWIFQEKGFTSLLGGCLIERLCFHQATVKATMEIGELERQRLPGIMDLKPVHTMGAGLRAGYHRGPVRWRPGWHRGYSVGSEAPLT